jgi:hypothetical protein
MRTSKIKARILEGSRAIANNAEPLRKHRRAAARLTWKEEPSFNQPGCGKSQMNYAEFWLAFNKPA